ncbi:hypothetical protein T492DRAFT_960752 [Pavlovales sp. CCMP2436]|nr:hypothetical protein T492DRAFT_960752 [Pavlovales sp. CCMP2436]
MECAILDALPSTALVLLVVIASAFALYALIFALRSAAGGSLGRVQRSAFVFLLDISKIALVQAGGVALSALFSRGAFASGKYAAEFDPLSWFFATSLVRETFVVLVALLFGGILTSGLFSNLGSRCGLMKWTGALHSFGRYSPDEAESESLIGGRSTGPRTSWWFAQLLLWLGCMAGARELAAVVLPILLALCGAKAPDYLLAKLIYGLKMPCATKQLVFAVALRIVAELILLALVDACNGYGGSSRRAGALGGQSTLAVGSRVRALWKYNAQYEDELSFEAGELIIIDGEVQGEELWFKGRIGERGGLIPSNYVVDEAGSAIGRGR